MWRLRICARRLSARSSSKGRPRHPNDIEQRDCIDFYDAANARPYDWELRRKREVLPLCGPPRIIRTATGLTNSAARLRELAR
jgi:hypothetical protein